MLKDMMQRLEASINFLPPIPAVMVELLDALNNEDIDMRAIARIISKDPSMSANILKVANSAFYRVPAGISTVDHAIRMLGIKEITTICLACGAYNVLRPRGNQKTFDLTEFWKHSVATGVISKKISREFKLKDQPVIYLGGLLHDIGKIIIDRFFHDAYKTVIQITHDECISMWIAEKRVLGESHDRIGGWVMERWKLPKPFVDIVKYHHSVRESPGDSKIIVALISLADQLARLRYFGFGGDKTGVVLTDTEEFKILEDVNPDIKDLDVFKFVFQLEETDEEIIEIEKILRG